MRITQNFTNRTYLKNNNRLLSNMNKSMTKIWTQKNFLRASEDAINASRAMTVRKSLRELDMYDENLEAAKGVFAAAETSLTTLGHDVYLNVQTKLETACNGSYNKDDLKIFANELRNYAGFAVETLNADYAERQLFGGTNNSAPPFKAIENADGTTTVTYNGVAVNDITDVSAVPGSKPIYIDIGIGIKYNENYEIDPQTAVDVSMNGAELTGYGKETGDDGKVYSKNYVQLIFDAAQALENGDVEYANATLDRFYDANAHVLTEITTLGSKQNSMDFYMTKNDDYRMSLKERQNNVEGCDMNQQIIDLEATKAAYNAILQMSSTILPKSIFDFI